MKSVFERLEIITLPYHNICVHLRLSAVEMKKIYLDHSFVTIHRKIHPAKHICNYLLNLCCVFI